MVPRSARFAPILAALLIAASGCLGADRALDAPPAQPPASTEPGPSRPPSIIDVPADVPVRGPVHDHDYWQGRTERVLLDAELPQGPAGLCAGASGAACAGGPSGANRIRIPTGDGPGAPNTVWPGTGRMTIEIDLDGTLLRPFRVDVVAPRRAAVDDFIVDTARKVVEIADVQENQTDPPHAIASGWHFLLSGAPNGEGQAGRWASASLYEGTLRWKVTIHRSDRALAIDPAHPDLWQGQEQRSLLDLTFKDAFEGAQVLRSSLKHFPDQVKLPEGKTVLPLTAILRATLTWTNTVPGQAPLALRACDASMACDTVDKPQALAPTRELADGRIYDVPLREDQADSPYAILSRWLFTFDFDRTDLGGEQAAVFNGSIRLQVEILKGASDET